MKRHFAIAILAASTAAAPLAARTPGQSASEPAAATAPVEVKGGTATFDTGTNVPAISVHGKSTDVRGRALIRQAGDAIAIEQLEATLPVSSISTGMGLRDEHMRKYVFTTTEGQVPDLKFVSEKAECTRSSGSESTCNVAGHLTIRGTPRPFAIALKVQKAGDGYKAQGDSVVKLSAYGIERPSQLGVTTTDDVKLHLEFTAKPTASASAARSGGIR